MGMTKEEAIAYLTELEKIRSDKYRLMNNIIKESKAIREDEEKIRKVMDKGEIYKPEHVEAYGDPCVEFY